MIYYIQTHGINIKIDIPVRNNISEEGVLLYSLTLTSSLYRQANIVLDGNLKLFKFRFETFNEAPFHPIYLKFIKDLIEQKYWDLSELSVAEVVEKLKVINEYNINKNKQNGFKLDVN